MPITAGQAIYGEKNHGHSLLAASPLAADVASDLVYQMDIQGTVPPGIEWRPFFSGFAHRGSYVLSLTSPDADASRSGMVRSRALFIPLAEAMGLAHLGSLLRALRTPLVGDLMDLVVEADAGSGASNPGLAKALLADGTGPVVWPSEEGFDEALEGLWRNLWPEARAGLSFRLAFLPQDSATQPTIVTTPVALAPRWTGHRIVDPGTTGGDQAVALLTGEEDGDALRVLIDAISADFSNIQDLKKVVEISNALRGEGAFADTLGALRLLCHLSPDPEKGAEQKAALIGICADQMALASAEEVRMARNLDLSALADPSPFWKALRGWASNNFASTDDPAIAARTLNEALAETGPLPAWQAAVSAGMADRLSDLGREHAQGLWQLFSVSPDLLRAVLALKPGDREVETTLSDTVPAKPPAGVADEWLGAAAEAKAIELHGACCAALFAPREAVERHLTLTSLTDVSLDRALAKASDKDLVRAALDHHTEQLLDRAASASAAKPALLAQLDMKKASARSLWARAIERNPAAWKGPREPRISFRQVLDAMLDEGLRDERLIAALAETPLANLLEYPRRSQVWPMLTTPSSGHYLAATADAWEERLIASSSDEAVEQPLAAELGDEHRSQQMLTRLGACIPAAALYFRALPALREREFETWLAGAVRAADRISQADAETLGSLVAARSWNNAARAIADHVIAGRTDLKPALPSCIEMIDLWRQFELGMFFGVSPEEAKWRTLEEIAVELYGRGPTQDSVWERAGGRAGDVPIADTGAQAWRLVFAAAKRGKRDIDVSRLIAVMASDYPHNRALNKMRHDPRFR